MDYEIRKKIVGIIIESLDCDTEQIIISDDTSLINDLGFDSISIIKLLSKIELSFGLDFSNCDNIAEIFESVGNLQNFIEGQFNGKK